MVIMQKRFHTIGHADFVLEGLKSELDLSSFHTPVVKVLQTLMARCLMLADLLCELLLQEHK